MVIKMAALYWIRVRNEFMDYNTSGRRKSKPQPRKQSYPVSAREDEERIMSSPSCSSQMSYLRDDEQHHRKSLYDDKRSHFMEYEPRSFNNFPVTASATASQDGHNSRCKKEKANNPGDELEAGTSAASANANSHPRPVLGRSATLPSTNLISISKMSRRNLNPRIVKIPLDTKTWKNLNRLISGNTGRRMDSCRWMGQGKSFIFDSGIPFGLAQKSEGGGGGGGAGSSSGVLAVVQAILIRNLIFGSPFTDYSEPGQMEERKLNLRAIKYFLLDNTGNSLVECVEQIRKVRVQSLVEAVTQIIWSCAEQRSLAEGKTSSRSIGNSTSIIVFNDSREWSVQVNGRLELQYFLQNSIHRLDTMALVYSAVLTRGIDGIREDMNMSKGNNTCGLIDPHGYCSQELINLLCLGRAQLVVDGKPSHETPTLITASDIGLLSLSEHYGSDKVGLHLKCPRYPIWVVQRESHYSILFSMDKSITKCRPNEGDDDNELEPVTTSNFDLFFYDGLMSGQEKVVHLSISIPESPTPKGRSSRSASDCFSDGFPKGMLADDELVSPIEKCIRTKWKGAVVNWNDAEPIF